MCLVGTVVRFISIVYEANALKKDITPRVGPKKGFYVSCIIFFVVTSALERCEEAIAILFYSVTDICGSDT